MELNAPLPSEKLFNLTMVEKMCRGNQNTIVLMIKTFIATTTEAITEFKNACQANDLLTIQRIAHRIKPTMAIYGITLLEQDIQTLEKCNEQAMAKQLLEETLQKLYSILEAAIQQIQTNYLNN